MKSWLHAHRSSVLFLLGVAVLGGIVAALQLPVALFPAIDFPRIAVTVDAGDRPADRMVIEITRPLEQALREVPEIAGIRSTSSRGSAELSLSFDWGTDMVAAQLQVESAVNRALVDLPRETRFDVRRMDPAVFPILGLTLTSNTRDEVALRDLATLRLRPMLSAVPGVAQVEVLGGQVAEYQVLLDPARLQANGLSVDDVSRALAASNVVTALGRLQDRYRLYVMLADNRLRGGGDIAHTPIKGTIQLGDVADLRFGVAPSWTRVTADGHNAVLINIRQQRSANAVRMVAAVREQLARHAAELPRDVRLGTFYDQSELVSAAATSVRDAILIGAALAGVVLLLFLRDLRLTMIVAIVLPAVLAVTTLLLSVFGMSFNIMTLGGMAAAVGLVVDDAVVMVEHFFRRRQEEDPAHAASALAAAQEMFRPLLGSSLATIVIFVPLAFLSGVAGGFFKALALTMSCALVVSFLVAALVVPLLADRLAPGRRPGPAPARVHWFERFTERYARASGTTLRHPATALVAALILAGAGALAFWRLPSGFIPVMDEGGFVLDYFAPPGTALRETDRLLREVEAIIRATPEVASYSRRTGLQLGGGLTEANEGDFFIKLLPPPRQDIEDVMADIRSRVEARVPGLEIETLQLMEDVIGDLTAVPQPVEVKLYGPDLAQLHGLARQVAAGLEKSPGFVEVRAGVRVAGDAIDVRIDPLRATLEGLDPEGAARQLATLVGGSIAGPIQAGEKQIDIRVWSQPGLRGHIESLRELRLRAPDGHVLPLRRIASIAIVSGQPQIVRENLEQMVPVTARLEGVDLGSGVRRARRLVQAMHLPNAVRVEYGGLYAEQQRSFRGLAAVFAAAVLLVMTLLLYLYEQWAVIVSILASIALSVAAVFIGLWLTGAELDISAMMGLTMIVGIVAEIAVFYFSELEAQDTRDAAALVTAGRRRLRPILMTTSIAILALLPLALGLGNGAEMQKPLAIAIISGLIAALPLVLILMPVLYLRIRRTSSGPGRPPAAIPV